MVIFRLHKNPRVCVTEDNGKKKLFIECYEN